MAAYQRCLLPTTAVHPEHMLYEQPSSSSSSMYGPGEHTLAAAECSRYQQQHKQPQQAWPASRPARTAPSSQHCSAAVLREAAGGPYAHHQHAHDHDPPAATAAPQGVVSAATGAGIIIGAYFAFYSTTKKFLKENTRMHDGGWQGGAASTPLLVLTGCEPS